MYTETETDFVFVTIPLSIKVTQLYKLITLRH